MCEFLRGGVLFVFGGGGRDSNVHREEEKSHLWQKRVGSDCYGVNLLFCVHSRSN